MCALWSSTELSRSKKEMSVRFLEDNDLDTAEELPINVLLSAELTNKTPTNKSILITSATSDQHLSPPPSRHYAKSLAYLPAPRRCH